MVRATPPIVFGTTLYLGVCLFALWKGGRAERIVSVAMLAELLLLFPAQSAYRDGPRYASLVLDLIPLAALFYVAFTTDLRWALFGSAAQILSVLTHLARIVDPTIHSWAYITVDVMWGYLLMAALFYGTVQNLRTARAYERR